MSNAHFMSSEWLSKCSAAGTPEGVGRSVVEAIQWPRNPHRGRGIRRKSQKGRPQRGWAVSSPLTGSLSTPLHSDLEIRPVSLPI